MRWSTTIVFLVQVAASFGYASDQPSGQLVFSPHIIDDYSRTNASVHAFDLDGDGEFDITATSRWSGEIFWWRNDGGRPVSWFQQRIATIPGAWPLTIVDVDGDGDNDVVAAGRHEVRWYSNEGRMIRVRPSGGRVRP